MPFGSLIRHRLCMCVHIWVTDMDTIFCHLINLSILWKFKQFSCTCGSEAQAGHPLPAWTGPTVHMSEYPSAISTTKIVR